MARVRRAFGLALHTRAKWVHPEALAIRSPFMDLNEFLMVKVTKNVSIVIWLLIVSILAYCIIKIDYEIKLRYDFNGVVENLTYNKNHYPIVTVGKVNYELSYDDWDCNNNKIEIGDKLIKRKGNMDLLLIKKINGDTINLLYTRRSIKKNKSFNK